MSRFNYYEHFLGPMFSNTHSASHLQGWIPRKLFSFIYDNGGFARKKATHLFLRFTISRYRDTPGLGLTEDRQTATRDFCEPETRLARLFFPLEFFFFYLINKSDARVEMCRTKTDSNILLVNEENLLRRIGGFRVCR